MAEINTTDYLDIINLYADASAQLENISQKYYDAAYEVVLLQTFDPEIDLLVPFYNAYLASDTAYSSALQTVINAVKTIQDHILSRGRDSNGNVFTDINDYYREHPTVFTTGVNAVIPTRFATISNQAGHRIEDGSAGDTSDFVN